MHLDQYVAELQQQLATAAAAGGDEARELATRLTAPLDAAARLALLAALSDAAGEISAELAPGSVDVRLRAGNPEFVVTAPRATTTDATAPTPAPSPQATEPVDTDGPSTTRTTLRLPDHLKAQAEVAAARDGVSVNTWLVRAVAGALEQSSGRPAARPAQRGSGRVTGWVR
ncbi:toxin-antitoxin system HicB family antitoxin [Isoptericola dokdonensis]|jgi:hypothetical protein|uniref:HicB family protein n=1 Tax=Isoptericola dokdonensis DS-3 TaxID=1300344 RepID=A0A161IKV9_9MICO|nr:toxin-antitoxin system HicB family antitoxin [Isoptericola dokdonensis]ANC31030.1 hypothetical protein I598_1477 [Isoptericola dokdonensis DS-3]